MFWNPLILPVELVGESKGSMSLEFVYVATILASAIACFIMGIVGKTFPIVLAPAMGINALVAFGVMGGMKYSPAEALALVLLSGILFLAVSLTPIRKYLINAIPKSLKLGIGAGIGFYF
jgi:Permeases